MREHAPLKDCVFCPANNRLVFSHITRRGVEGYVIPGSKPIRQDGKHILLPLPASWLIVTGYHKLPSGTGVDTGYESDWNWHREQLLNMVPTIGLGSYNTSANHGHAAGACGQIGLQCPHPLEWVVTGRGFYGEITPEQSRQVIALGGSNGNGATAGLDLATLVHLSRQAAGSLPSDDKLLEIWLNILDSHPSTDAVRRYNEWTAAYAEGNK